LLLKSLLARDARDSQKRSRRHERSDVSPLPSRFGRTQTVDYRGTPIVTLPTSVSGSSPGGAPQLPIYCNAKKGRPVRSTRTAKGSIGPAGEADEFEALVTACSSRRACSPAPNRGRNALGRLRVLLGQGLLHGRCQLLRPRRLPPELRRRPPRHHQLQAIKKHGLAVCRQQTPQLHRVRPSARCQQSGSNDEVLEGSGRRIHDSHKGVLERVRASSGRPSRA
jgi:hypothetical protein